MTKVRIAQMKRLILGFLAATALAACGGNTISDPNSSGSSSSSSSNSSSSSSTGATSITLTTSSPQLQSDGVTPVTITAVVKDVNNVVMSGQTVNFSTTSGDLTVTQPTTDDSGVAKATLSIGSAQGAKQNRTITVGAVSGGVSNTIPVDVIGTTLSISGQTSLVLNNSGTYTITLLDSSSKAISGQSVTVSSSGGNTLSAALLTTDSTGKATVNLNATIAGTDTLTATALGETAGQQISISGQSFQFTSPASGSTVLIGQANAVPVTVRWLNNNAPVTGQSVSFAATRGTLSAASATTNGSGDATVTVYSTGSGPAVISATASGVSAQLAVTFIATDPDSISVQASPTTIATQGKSTIAATVVDANGNLVEGQQVNFAISEGMGSLSLASALTNSAGQAQTVYTAASTPSGSNGVTVTATIPAPATPTTDSASVDLTVGGQTVFLSLNTGNKLSENGNKTQFIQPWSVQAVDSAGNPVDGVDIVLTVHSTNYAKGNLTTDDGAHNWEYDTSIYECVNEDSNLNGVFELSDFDENNNDTLEPGDKAVAVPGSGKTATGSDGTAGTLNFTVNYGESYNLWLEVMLTATATVNGTESSTSVTYWLPGLSSYFADKNASPPGEISPFGTNDCVTPN